MLVNVWTEMQHLTSCMVPLQGAEDGLQDMHRMQERLLATVR